MNRSLLPPSLHQLGAVAWTVAAALGRKNKLRANVRSSTQIATVCLKTLVAQ